MTAVGGCSNLGATIVGAGTQPCGMAYSKIWVGGAPGFETEWNDPNNWFPVGVPGATDQVHIPSATYQPVLSGAGAVLDLSVASGATLDLGGGPGISVQQDVVVDGTLLNGSLFLGGTSGLLQGNLDDFDTNGQSRTLTGALTLTGNLFVSQYLEVGANTLTVSGDVTTSTGSGRVVMQSGSSVVDIAGSYTVDGPSMNGYMTNGTLSIAGDLTVNASQSTTSFYGTSTHQTVFDGTGAQTITFSSPGNQRFNDLDVINATTVELATSATVQGRFDADGQSLTVTALGPVLNVRGTVDAQSSTFDGLRLDVSVPTSLASNFISSLTFQNMDPAASQLRLALNGPGTFTMNGMMFSTAPTTGAYIDASSNNSTAYTIQMTSPTPAGPVTEVLTDDFTTINW